MSAEPANVSSDGQPARPASGPVDVVIAGRQRDLGGVTVRRILPSRARRMVGPFIFLDHLGPVALDPARGIDVGPHPHIGLATVTYLIEGELIHRDSVGSVQPIRPGAVNWMTAGRGIVHSERSSPEDRIRGARIHGLQSWVALPAQAAEVAPAFAHHPADSLPVIEGDGRTARLIAGSAFGVRSPVATFSPMFYLDAVVDRGATVPLPDEHAERAIYVVAGEIVADGEPIAEGALALVRPRTGIEVRATRLSRLMLLGGAPLPGDWHIWWNFVAGSRARIEQAKDDWKNGRFPKVPDEQGEIPLPEA